MDGYLLDTCAISALLDGRHKNYANVRMAVEAIEAGSPQFVSRVTIAELSFGFRIHEAATGLQHSRASEVLRRVQDYPIREITKHTATEYAELRKNLAITHLSNLVKKPPRWVDNWIEKITGESLQVDENDLWICAQALEANLTLLTTDEKMVQRMLKADPNIKFRFVRSV